MRYRSSVACYPHDPRAPIQQRCCVLTPPEYWAAERVLPVVYLLHGIREDERDWHTRREFVEIIDSLLDARYIAPAVVVMPYGFTSLLEQAAHRMPDVAAFDAALAATMVQVEGAYPRIGRDRAQRAIAGISMGGKQAIEFGLAHLERFSVIGTLSAAIQGSPVLSASAAPHESPQVRQGLRFFFSRCGDRDAWRPNGTRRTEHYDLAALNHTFAERLRQASIDCDAAIESGHHDWHFWSAQLPVLLTSIVAALAPSRALQSLIESILSAIHAGTASKSDSAEAADFRHLPIAIPPAWPASTSEEVLQSCGRRLPDDFDRAASESQLHAQFLDACDELLASTVESCREREIELPLPLVAAHWRVAQSLTASALFVEASPHRAAGEPRPNYVGQVPLVTLRGAGADVLATFRAARLALNRMRPGVGFVAG